MVGLIKISPIFFLLIWFVDIKSQSTGWEPTSPDNFDYMAEELTKSLSIYLGKTIVVNRIITSADINNYADDVRYAVFCEVEEDNAPAFYECQAHFVFRGNPAIRVDFARRYGS